MPPVMAGRWAQIRSLWTRPAAQWPGAGRVPRLPVIACSSDPSGTGREVASRHAPRADTTGGYASLIPPAEADRGAPRSALSWSPNLAKPCPAGGRQPFKHGRSVLLRHSDPGAGPGRQRAERAAVSATTAASRSQGSQQQAARSGSPNGPEGGDREDRGGPDRQRDQVLRGGSAGDVPPSVRRRPRAGCRDRPAVRGRPGRGGWAGTRRASRSEAAAGRSVSGAGRLVAASSGPGGGHGSCPRVSWPDRSAAMWAASQACRAAAGSAASRRAAA